MQDQDDIFAPDLSGLDDDEWRDEIASLGEERGFGYPMGDHHRAVFVEAGNRLIVTFENAQTVREHAPKALPFGFEMAARNGWSTLTVLSEGESWFRGNLIYGFFDYLLDEGFFDGFDQLLFYGVGSCGYAAAAYSVVCPGARVLALQPQATLNPRVTEWEERFRVMRRVSFTDRYGYAPDMLDAAEIAWVMYDPRHKMDAMHAALFTRPNVVKLRTPSLGVALDRTLREIGCLHDLVEAAAEGDLGTVRFARMMRARRDNAGYMLRLLAAVEEAGHLGLAEQLCRHAMPRFGVPRFRRRLRQYARLKARDETGADSTEES